jgi:hypothetical protein
MRFLCKIVVMLASLAAAGAHAAVTITILQSGSDLVVNSSGTLNTSACQSIGPGFVSAFAGIDPSIAVFAFGPSGSAQDQCVGTTISPSTAIGTAGILTASSSAGLSYYFQPTSGFWGPAGFTDQTDLVGTMTFTGESLASAGLSAGSFQYTLSANGNSDTITVNIVDDVIFRGGFE